MSHPGMIADQAVMDVLLSVELSDTIPYDLRALALGFSLKFPPIIPRAREKASAAALRLSQLCYRNSFHLKFTPRNNAGIGKYGIKRGFALPTPSMDAMMVCDSGVS